MSMWTKIVRATVGIKAEAGRVRFPSSARVFFDLDRPDQRDLEREVGDGTSSDVLMTPIRWLQRAIIEAPWIAADAAGELIDPSDLVNLLNKPNPFYSGEVLLAGTLLSMALDGNAYWIAAMNADGIPVELWYAPHTNIEPEWPDGDSTMFVTHYKYSVQGQEQKIRPAGADDEDVHPGVEEGLAVIHFREGIDPNNLRKGLSPLKGLLREVWTDNEAASFTASLLRNGAIPGVVVSPTEPGTMLTPAEAEQTKDKFETEYTRGNRGRVLVSLAPTKVEQFGFSPQELNLSPLRNVAEERVTAALGVVAAVVGFGSGLQQTKVGATMKELRGLSWTNGVIPMQRIIAGEVTRWLALQLNAVSAAFDNSGVEALRENQDNKAARVERMVRAAIFTRAEGRVELGQEVFPGDDVYLMSLATLEVPQGVAAPDPRVSGNGASSEEERAHIEAFMIKYRALTADDLVGKVDPIKLAYWKRVAADFLKRHNHSHGLNEERIIAAAPSRRATQTAARMARRLDGVRVRAGAVMQEPLERVFEDLGRSALAAAQDALEAAELASDRSGEQKLGFEFGYQKRGDLTPGEIAAAEAIANAIDTASAQTALQGTFEFGYLQAQDMTSNIVVDILGEFELGDVVQQNVLRQGGLRAGLVDMDAQTREAVFNAMAEGRAQGMTADNLARFIRDSVEAGPWRDAATRARVIARTEGAHAANVSILETARGMPDTEHVQVFDDRLGQGDEECVAADGTVITIEEAEAIGLAHPNCTRSFVPVNSLLMEEMGL